MARTEGLARRLSANSSSLWPMWSSPSFITVSFLLLFSPSFPHIRFHTFSFFSVCLSWISVDMIQMLLFITQKFDIWAFLYSPPSEKSFFGDSKSNPQDLTLPEFMAERKKCVPDTNRYYFGFASTRVFRTFWRIFKLEIRICHLLSSACTAFSGCIDQIFGSSCTPR